MAVNFVMNNEIYSLMGSIVSFQDKESEATTGQSIRLKGLVTGVLFNLDGQHEISVKDFADKVHFYKLSNLLNLKSTQIDPLAFFDNVKSGLIQLDI